MAKSATKTGTKAEAKPDPKAAAKAGPKPAKKQDAVALLRADHRKVEDLFSDYQSETKPAKKRKIAQQICLELSVHTRIEEEIFYPAVRGRIKEDTVTEAYVEHDAAKVLIAEIAAGDPKAEFYDAKVHVLSEMIKHHVHEEEAFLQGMFAQARRTDLDMKALGAALATRKAELVPAYKKALPKPATPSFDTVSI